MKIFKFEGKIDIQNDEFKNFIKNLKDENKIVVEAGVKATKICVEGKLIETISTYGGKQGKNTVTITLDIEDTEY